MKKQAAQKLKPGDWVLHGARYGRIKSNDETTLTIAWADGEESAGSHARAWMIEKTKPQNLI